MGGLVIGGRQTDVTRLLCKRVILQILGARKRLRWACPADAILLLVHPHSWQFARAYIESDMSVFLRHIVLVAY